MRWIMNIMPAVSKPRKKKDIAFSTKASPSFCMKDVPSKRLFIHIGRTLFIKREANPNVQTTIRDDFRCVRNSSA